MVHHEHRGRHLLDDRLKALLCRDDGLLGPLARGDLDEGDHNAGNPIVVGAIRQRAPQVPTIAVTENFSFERGESRQYLRGIGQKVAAGEFLGQVRQGATDVRRDQLQQIGHRRGESTDSQLGVQEHDGDIRAAQKSI